MAIGSDEDGLALLRDSLQQLTELLVAEEHLETVLQRVVDLAQTTIGACDLASITYLTDAGPTTMVCTDPAAESIDEVQYTTDSGPCLDASRARALVSVASMSTDGAYPEFRRAAARFGVHSSLSLPLAVGAVQIGALNLYGRTDGAFASVPADTALLFAAQATAAVWNARLHDQARAVMRQLETALETRDVIGVAKGIIMANEKLTVDQAFERLRTASQRRNVKLREVAVEVATTGATPAL